MIPIRQIQKYFLFKGAFQDSKGLSKDIHRGVEDLRPTVVKWAEGVKGRRS